MIKIDIIFNNFQVCLLSCMQYFLTKNILGKSDNKKTEQIQCEEKCPWARKLSNQLEIFNQTKREVALFWIRRSTHCSQINERYEIKCCFRKIYLQNIQNKNRFNPIVKISHVYQIFSEILHFSYVKEQQKNLQVSTDFLGFGKNFHHTLS